MYSVPTGLYADVRIEDRFETTIIYMNEHLEQSTQQQDKGAFLRVFDGNRWYYTSITDLTAIQAELDSLCAMAKPNADIGTHPVVDRFEVNTGDHRRFQDKNVRMVTRQEKLDLLEAYTHVRDMEDVIHLRRAYKDQHIEKTFWSSKGADLQWDYQRTGYYIAPTLAVEDQQEQEHHTYYGNHFDELVIDVPAVEAFVAELRDYVRDAVACEQGDFPVILSPNVAGVFAHESFGHHSEADSIMANPAIQEKWTLGKTVGAPCLTILDDGSMEGHGHIIFDDEGSRGRNTYLIKDGVLTGRLHGAMSAGLMNEDITGNARAINFEFEPIVRMTSTVFGPGEASVDDLFAGVENGYYIKTYRHGSGSENFTIAPGLSYRIRDGKIAEPVRISVVRGNVLKTLHEIDGVSDKVELFGDVLGGCGKNEQMGLPTVLGGPFVRAAKMTIM